MVLAFAAAGCGDSGPRGLDPVAAAADRTLDKQTGRFTTQLGGTGMLGDLWVVPRGSGWFSVPDEAVGATFSCCPGPTDITTVLEYRMMYPVAYAGYENGSFMHPSVSKWMKVDLKRKLEKQLSSLEPEFQAVISRSPIDSLALLRGSRHAKKLGAETVDGMRTTHYGVTVDAEQAFAKATPNERRALQLARLQGRDAVPRQIDVWVGSDGLVRLVRQKLRNGVVFTTFSQLGRRVEIKPPPAAEVVDAS